MPDNFGAPVPLKKETDPFGTAVPLSSAGPPVAPVPKVNMQTSWVPRVVRAATSTLPAIGATVGGLIAAPGIATGALGAGLGAAGGKEAELGANRVIFGNDEPDPNTLRSTVRAAEEGASYAVPAAAMETGTRALFGQPLESGFRIAPPFTQEELAAQRAANRSSEEKLAQFMNRGYRPAPVATPSVATPNAPKVAIAGPEESYVLPEPRGTFAGEKPTSMYSIPRDQLLGMAQSAKPGAADVLRNLGKPVIYEPTSTVGFPGSPRIIAAPEEEDEELPTIRDRAAD